MPFATVAALTSSGNLRLRTARLKESRFYDCYPQRNLAALITELRS